MNVKKGNSLILIENGQIKSYDLDDKNTWEIGRPSKDNNPDIKLSSLLVSRRHGKLRNMDGTWFYVDYYAKNGTFLNNRHLTTGLGGRVKPVILKDGDTFVFGGGKDGVINCKTVFGMFVTEKFDEKWKTIDSRGYENASFILNGKETPYMKLIKGTVIKENDGIGIYMGDLTYLIGNVEFKGR